MKLLLPLMLSIGLAEGQNLGRESRPLITTAVSEAKLATLIGNTRPEARPEYDQGKVAQNLALNHMLLQLKRPPDREAALEAYIDDLHDPNSPTFHRWLTPAQIGELYGPNQADVDRVVSWLESGGFAVHTVYPSGMTIDFSGTAGQVSTAFHTEIHRLLVNGQEHISNMSDPRVPEALSPVIDGVVSLHNFRPHRLGRARRQFTGTTSSGTSMLLVPSDIATIYNLTPLLNQGITGSGQTIAVLEDSDFYSTNDWATFRSTFGLVQYTTGSLSTVHPNPTGSSSCSDPGVDTTFGDDGEAEADSEMATAAAPGAAIIVASCAGTNTTFGVQIAAQNLVNSTPLPTIMELSYGECEPLNGAASNAAYNSAYQQAVAEGISIFVASGDEGAAGCDSTPNSAQIWASVDGVAVNALASSPYDVAVGGTDFSDTYSNTSGVYWNSTNNANYGSAKSYIPEIPWNDTCGGTLYNLYEGNATPTYGASGFCNSFTAGFDILISTVAASGGPSNCATGNVSYLGGAVGGGCAGYPKPSWQVGILGNPNDGVRDLPDVSLFASDGYLWNHTYIFCFSDPVFGLPCDSNPADWTESGGTSFSAPLMAGIQALINQKTGSRQGLPNYYYYRIAAAEFGSSGSSSCNSSHGASVSGSCIFYDVTQGDIDVPCIGTSNCFASNLSLFGSLSNLPIGPFKAASSSASPFPYPGNAFPGATLRGSTNSGTYGVLSTARMTYAPAFRATTGWDFASGIGSVNAYNLANAWTTITAPAANRAKGLELKTHK